jgi:hypothetical protein
MVAIVNTLIGNGHAALRSGKRFLLVEAAFAYLALKIMSAQLSAVEVSWTS